MDALKAAIAAKRKAAEDIKLQSGKKYVRRGDVGDVTNEVCTECAMCVCVCVRACVRTTSYGPRLHRAHNTAANRCYVRLALMTASALAIVCARFFLAFAGRSRCGNVVDDDSERRARCNECDDER